MISKSASPVKFVVTGFSAGEAIPLKNGVIVISEPSKEFQSVPLSAGPKLSVEYLTAKSKLELALQRACQALMEVSEMETNNPGMLTEAHITTLEMTKEKLDLLTKCIGKIRKSLEWRKVGALC